MLRKGDLISRARCGNPGNLPLKIEQLVREGRRLRRPLEGNSLCFSAPECLGGLAASICG